MKERDISCPKCGSINISPIFYGVSGVNPLEKKNGEVLEGLSYMYSPDHPPRHCNNCGHEW